MFKKLFTEGYNSDDMTLEIDLMKEIKKKYGLKKLPVHLTDDFKPEFTYDRKSKHGKMRVYVNTTDYSSPVYEYEWI